MSIDTRDALQSLRSKTCPACGRSKPEGHSLCRDDFMRLTQRQRERLYGRMRQGYEAALDEALSALGVNAPFQRRRSMPEAQTIGSETPIADTAELLLAVAKGRGITLTPEEAALPKRIEELERFRVRAMGGLQAALRFFGSVRPGGPVLESDRAALDAINEAYRAGAVI